MCFGERLNRYPIPARAFTERTPSHRNGWPHSLYTSTSMLRCRSLLQNMLIYLSFSTQMGVKCRNEKAMSKSWIIW